MPILTVVFTEGRNDLPHAYHQRQAIGGPFQGWPPALSFHDDVTHVDANHAAKYIEETACPVCLRLLVTAKQEAALDKVLDAIKELEDSIRGTPDLPKKGGAVCWLVGGYGPGPPPAF